MIDPTELHQRHWEDQDPTTAHINQQADRITQLERERDEAQEQCNRAMLALGVYDTIRNESEGVIGWHPNGTVTAWNEFDIPDVPITDAPGPEADDEALRERVAKALCLQHLGYAIATGDFSNEMMPRAYRCERGHWFSVADAAIRAMRGDQ